MRRPRHLLGGGNSSKARQFDLSLIFAKVSSASLCGSTLMTRYEFTPGCSVRALVRAGVPRSPERRPIACEQEATGLVSKPGKLSQPNSNRPRPLSERRMAAPNGSAAHTWPCPRGMTDHRAVMPYLLDVVLPSPHDVKGNVFMRCATTGQLVAIALQPGPSYLLDFQNRNTYALPRLSKRSVVELRHGLGRLKAPDRRETAALSSRRIARPARRGGPQFSRRWRQSSQSICVSVS
jgi:hypothetical protein